MSERLETILTLLIIKTNFNKLKRYVSKSVYSLLIIYICAPYFIAQSLNYVIVVGKRLPRNPTTKRSPRAPKLKEDDIGEGSSLGTTRQMEYAPRVDPIIKTTTKKYCFHPPNFGDIEESIGSKVALSEWEYLFNRVSQE
jgi:hypothetical protein